MLPPPLHVLLKDVEKKAKQVSIVRKQTIQDTAVYTTFFFFFFKHQDAQGGPVLTLNTAFSTAVKIATCYPLIREPSPSLKKRWVIPYLEQHKVDQEGLT